MEYLSGATGYTILSKNNKNILLLADIHDGVNYCVNQQQSDRIDNFLQRNNTSHQILLEESINDPSLNLTDLWPDAEHTRRLKILKENDRKIIPTDIRPYLIPFSWQLAESNDKYKNLQITKYLYFFSIFFSEKSSIYYKYIVPYYEYIDYHNKMILLGIFKQIKKLFNRKYEMYKGKTLREILELDKSYMHSIDNINSLIMEYYILLLIFSDKRDSIIHTGLAHSTRIKSILVEEFKFNIVEDIDMTQIKDYTGSHNTKACIINPSNSVFFNKKKSMFI
jgi:hypothetical protein